MGGSNENLVQHFSNKLEGMSYLGIPFKSFSFCYASYSVFSTEIYSSELLKNLSATST